MFTDYNPINIPHMTYKEFCDYCEDRCCDGMWSYEMALICIQAIECINSIKFKRFGFVMRKKTDKARELRWQQMKKDHLDDFFIRISKHYN